MAWFQIGDGYYGLSTASVKVSQNSRALAAKAFHEAFSAPAAEIRVEPSEPIAIENSPQPPVPAVHTDLKD